MGLPYPFYEIAILDGALILKIKTDKAWLELLPLSETTFYHVSSFGQFEVVFLPETDGSVNQFQYQEGGKTYNLTRIEADSDETATPIPTLSPTPPLPTETATRKPTSTLTATSEPTVLPPTPSLTNQILVDDQQPALQPQQTDRLSYLLVIPVGFILILVGWLIFRRRKS
jgi:hypothetical protein